MRFDTAINNENNILLRSILVLFGARQSLNISFTLTTCFGQNLCRQLSGALVISFALFIFHSKWKWLGSVIAARIPLPFFVCACHPKTDSEKAFFLWLTPVAINGNGIPTQTHQNRTNRCFNVPIKCYRSFDSFFNFNIINSAIEMVLSAVRCISIIGKWFFLFGRFIYYQYMSSTQNPFQWQHLV